MFAANHGQVLRRLLEPPAHALGVDYNLHSLFVYGELPEMPGGRQEDVAFGLLAAAGPLLAAKTYSDEFPARGRTARRGAKRLLKCLGEPQTVEASAAIARAQGLLAAERQRAVGNEGDAIHHLAAADLLQEHVPLGEKALDALNHRLATSFTRARELRGEETPEDAAPEAIAAQQFEQWATIEALTLALGSEFMEEKALDHLLLPGTSWESLVAGYADEASGWLAAEERRMTYVREALARGWI